jgi:hypothetical protein
MIELDFYIYVFSMELRSFEKPYVALLNSSNWATGGPLDKTQPQPFCADEYFFVMMTLPTLIPSES